jgi:hypothetical protein
VLCIGSRLELCDFRLDFSDHPFTTGGDLYVKGVQFSPEWFDLGLELTHHFLALTAELGGDRFHLSFETLPLGEYVSFG